MSYNLGSPAATHLYGSIALQFKWSWAAGTNGLEIRQVFQGSNAGKKTVCAATGDYETREPGYRLGSLLDGDHESTLLRRVVAHQRISRFVQTGKVTVIQPRTHNKFELSFQAAINEQAKQSAFDAVVGIGRIIWRAIGHSAANDAPLMTISARYRLATRIAAAHVSPNGAAVSPDVAGDIIIVVDLVIRKRRVRSICIGGEYKRYAVTPAATEFSR